MQSELEFKQSAPQNDLQEKFEKLLSGLNDAQAKAVDKVDGPVLVVAGPGTGKTQIIAARIGKILNSTDLQVEPHNILCLTYTDAGTIAMRKRLLQFIGPIAYNVNIYTFHAFCNDVIQNNLDLFGKRQLEPISDLENIQLLEKLIDSLDAKNPIKRLKGDIYFEVYRLNNLFRRMKEEDWMPEKIELAVKTYLNELPLREEYIYKRGNAKKGIKIGDVKQHEIDKEKEKMDLLLEASRLFPKYQEMMLNANRYDYSDMILWVLDAFKKNENLLRDYQEQFQYVLVDEFQDTSGAQNELLQYLISYWDTPNIFVVGDEDQSIYEFQGARVKNILDFYHKYQSDITTITLTENYRSTQAILDTAKLVIDNNTDRLVNKIEGIDKTLLAQNRDILDSKILPKIIQYYNAAHEEAAILSEIETLKSKEVPLNEIAIIYYKHRQAENLIQLFEKRGIPYQAKKKINILEEPIVGNFLKLFEYIHLETRISFSGQHLLFSIMHFDFFNIKPLDIAKISVHCGKAKKKTNWRELGDHPKELAEIAPDSFNQVIDFFKKTEEWIKDTANLTLPMLAEKIMNQSGLLNKVLEGSNKMFDLQVLKTFFDFIKSECTKKPSIKIDEFLETINQLNNHKLGLNINKTAYSDEGVNFITAHSSKGLEFKYVYLIGCTADMWEASRGGGRGYSLPDTLTFSTNENQTETARRLFYVAMTRAKEHLQISYAARQNEGKNLEKSKFVAEAEQNLNIITEEEKHVDDQTLLAVQISELQQKDETKLALPDKSFLDSLLQGYSMSITHLNKYLRCPVAFYYENILRVPMAKNDSMAFGNAVHYALKRLFEKMRDEDKFPSIDIFEKDFEYELYRNRDSFTDKQFERRLALGKQVLPEYYNQYISTWNKIVTVEYRIANVQVDGVPINGMIDKIEFSGNEVNVVDYKTGDPEYGQLKTKPPGEREPYGGDYWRQIVFYKILMDNQTTKKWKMISGEIDFVEKSLKRKEFIKQKIMTTQEDAEFVKKLIKGTYSNIMNHEFSKGCEEEDCVWCNFVKE